MENECEALPGVAYPGVRDNRSTINTKTEYEIGFGTSLPKTTFWTKIGGGLGHGSSQENIGTPYVFFATVEASNFKFGTQIGFGTSLPKTTFWTIIGGGLGQGSSHKNLGPPTYFCNR